MDIRKRPVPVAGNAGFTLIELIVAFALVALISLLLGGGVRFGARVWETTHAQVDAAEEVLAVRRFIRERALAARPAAVGDEAGEEAALAFEGHVGWVRLVTLMPPYAAAPGLYHMEIAETSGPQGRILDLSWWPLGADALGGEGQGRVLLSDIAEMRVTYFGDPEGRGSPTWHESWPSGPVLPRLLSVMVAFPADDPRVWPELIVPLPAWRPAADARGDG